MVLLLTLGLMVFILFAARANPEKPRAGLENARSIRYPQSRIILRFIAGVFLSALFVISLTRDDKIDIVIVYFASAIASIVIFCGLLGNATRWYAWNDGFVEMQSFFSPHQRFAFADLSTIYYDDENSVFTLDFGRYGALKINDDYKGTEALIAHAKATLADRAAR